MERLQGIATAGSRFAVVTLLVLGFIGCGAGDSGQEEGAAARSEFIEQANAICDQANEILREAVIEAFGPEQQPDDSAGIRFTRQVWIPNIRQQDSDLRELEWPPADQEKIDSMLTEITRIADRVEADPALASQGPFDKVTRRLTAYGIGACGSP